MSFVDSTSRMAAVLYFDPQIFAPLVAEIVARPNLILNPPQIENVVFWSNERVSTLKNGEQ